MPRRTEFKWGDKTVHTDVILDRDDEIWPETVNLLAKALTRAIDLLEDYGGGVDRTTHALQEQVGRIAEAMFPAVFERAREREEAFQRKMQEYRARQKKPIPRALRKAVFERDGFKCKHCGGQWELAADHIIPESKGGPTTLENLQTLCKKCNSRKCNRMPSDS